MAKTFVPTMVTDIHEVAMYLTKYGATLRAAILILQPEALPAYDAVVTAVLALDAFRLELAPIEA